ncbi:MAG TPA: type II CAAX endopeptidase family protein [Acidobacteriota bacterium]|nr:type II CAAX endopeptidase family protein [Acidobacteriota bacterium]
MSNDRVKAIITFLVLNWLFSSVFYALVLFAGTLGAGGGNYVIGLMWCPAFAALATCRIRKISLAELGWHWPKAKYAFLSYVIPLLYALVAYTIVWATGLAGFFNQEFIKKIAAGYLWNNLSPGAIAFFYILLAATYGVIKSCTSALGEEIGWRGFLVPQLAKVTSFNKTALLSGIIWSIWHYPLLIFSDYNSGTPAWYGVGCFTIMVIGISFVFAYLRLKSGSLWTGTLLHASHNLFIQGIFDTFSRETKVSKYVIGEFGAALAIMGIIVGVIFWRLGAKELATSSTSLDSTPSEEPSPVPTI